MRAACRATRSRSTTLGPKTVYIIHGDAEDNVWVTHARQMFTTLGPLVPDLTYHEKPGARHW